MRIGEFRWVRPPSYFLPPEMKDRYTEVDYNGGRRGDSIVTFKLVLGNLKFGLFVRKDKAPSTTSSGQSHDSFIVQASSELQSDVVGLDGKDLMSGCAPSTIFKNLSFYLSSLNEEWICTVPFSDYPLFSALTRTVFLPRDFIDSLQILEFAGSVYNTLERATISLALVNTAKPLSERANVSMWTNAGWDREPLCAFSCIALFDTGKIEIPPNYFENALAMVIDNSIYVTKVMITDPFVHYNLRTPLIRRIVGNIGKTGVSILVPPKRPLVRGLSDSYKLVNHEMYNFKREDCFSGTSLHLNFTEWALPVGQPSSHTIDHDVWHVESVISVRDRGEWLADLDPVWYCVRSFVIAECLDPKHDVAQPSNQRFVSIDN